jgi:predicted ABC-type exoprotein transport system permease subunit
MIALKAMPPEPQPRHVERGRSATKRRKRHAHRRSYVAFLRVGAVAAVFVIPLMLYVMLTANLTSLNYKLARVEAQKIALQAETMRQDDRIAKLESRERLSALAAQLKMHDPQVYAVISLPQTHSVPAPPHGIALLGAMNQWLSAAAGDVSH